MLIADFVHQASKKSKKVEEHTDHPSEFSEDRDGEDRDRVSEDDSPSSKKHVGLLVFVILLTSVALPLIF
jgi:hypothetical protein